MTPEEIADRIRDLVLMGMNMARTDLNESVYRLARASEAVVQILPEVGMEGHHKTVELRAAIDGVVKDHFRVEGEERSVMDEYGAPIFRAEALKPGACHPDPEIDAEVRADAAAGARSDLTAGMAVQTCPKCGRSHSRGFIDGHSAFRCLHCGEVFSPTETEDDVPEGTSGEAPIDVEFESLGDIWDRVAEQCAGGEGYYPCVRYRNSHFGAFVTTDGASISSLTVRTTEREALLAMAEKLEGDDG